MSSTLDPGAGQLEVFGWLRGDEDEGAAGGAVEYEHRLTEGAAAWARGALGYGWRDTGRGWEYEALGGLRWRF